MVSFFLAVLNFDILGFIIDFNERNSRFKKK